MKAVQTYSKEQAFQASDVHSPVSFAIQQSELPICYRQGLKGQQHLSCDCPQQAFQSPPQDLKLCLSRCAWGVITKRTQKLCPVHAYIWPCLLRANILKWLLGCPHSLQARWKSQRKLSFEKLLFPWHPCQDVENEENEQQLAAPASKPGFGYWQWVMRLWKQSSGDSQS